jgi:tripartite-type tricarboxylate transporter receptor subunit TctC
VVENKPGAGGNLGTALAAMAAPDGYSLVGAASGPMAANLTLYKELGYDPQKDLVLISPFASFTIVVTASKKLGVTTLKDLIERAKKEPGALNYGSVGIGSSQHLAGEYFAQIAKVKLTHVPYRNIAQFGPDLIAGTVQLGFAWYPNVSGPLTADGAIALAVAGDARLPVLPDTVTTAQADLPQYKFDGWFGLGAPAGVPRDILERLNAALNEALKDPAVRVRFEAIGAVPTGLELDKAKTFLVDEVVKYRDIITKAEIAKIE